MRRLAAIMIDAAERAFVLELAASGELPTIARMLDAGAFVPTHTPVPFRAEHACTELLTGRTAEENRYWSTVVFDPATYTCATIGSARRTPFYAVAPNGPVILFDVPHSVLVDRLPGTQIVGWGGHDARFQHPRVAAPDGLMDEIDVRFGHDPVAAVEYSGDWHQPSYIDALADALIASARRRAEIAVWLQARVPDWQLLLMGLTETHSAGHTMAHGMDPNHLLGAHPTAALARRRLIEVYRAVDDTIAAVEAAAPPGTTMAVFASKGMQPNREDVAALFLVPELLHRLAFGRALLHQPAQRHWRRAGMPPVWPDPTRSARNGTDRLRADGRLAGVKRRFHTTAPPALVRVVKRARRGMAGTSMPSEPRLLERTPDGDVPVLAGDVDWSGPTWYRHRWPSMPWFGLPSFSDPHIRLNVRGRERDGIVAPEDYDRTCDQLEAELRRATDPRTGEPIVDEVVRVRADDPFAADGPSADLVVLVRAPVDALEHPACGVVGPFAFPRSGSHTENGFLLVNGPGVDHRTLDLRPAIDVPATLVDLLGWPMPDTLSGAPLKGLAGALSD